MRSSTQLLSGAQTRCSRQTELAILSTLWWSGYRWGCRGCEPPVSTHQSQSNLKLKVHVHANSVSGNARVFDASRLLHIRRKWLTVCAQLLPRCIVYLAVLSTVCVTVERQCQHCCQQKGCAPAPAGTARPHGRLAGRVKSMPNLKGPGASIAVEYFFFFESSESCCSWLCLRKLVVWS